MMMAIGGNSVDWRALIALSVCHILYGNDGRVYIATRRLNVGSSPSKLLIYSTNRDAWQLEEALKILLTPLGGLEDGDDN